MMTLGPHQAPHIHELNDLGGSSVPLGQGNY